MLPPGPSLGVLWRVIVLQGVSHPGLWRPAAETPDAAGRCPYRSEALVPLNSWFRLTLKMPTLSVQVVTSLHPGVLMSLSPLPFEFLHGCFLSPVVAVLPLPRAQLPAVC